MEGLSLAVVACHRTRWYLASTAFPDVGQLSLVFPILDVVLFEMRMDIICVNNFSVYLRDKGASVTSRVISREMLIYHVLLEIKSLQEYVGCDLVARIEMAVLNQLMGTTRRARTSDVRGME
jgi:hypothetical protein